MERASNVSMHSCVFRDPNGGVSLVLDSSGPVRTAARCVQCPTLTRISFRPTVSLRRSPTVDPQQATCAGGCGCRLTGLLTQVLKLTPQMQWPRRMPREGLLEVDFRTSQLVADTRVPVLDEQFDSLHGPTLAATADVTDAFRSTFCQVPPSPTLP